MSIPSSKQVSKRAKQTIAMAKPTLSRCSATNLRSSIANTSATGSKPNTIRRSPRSNISQAQRSSNIAQKQNEDRDDNDHYFAQQIVSVAADYRHFNLSIAGRAVSAANQPHGNEAHFKHNLIEGD